MKIGERELLFQAKEETTGKWIEGLPYYTTEHGPNGATCVLQLQKIGEHGEIWMPGVRVKAESLGEFTGKYDDNRKRLFTGDIISIKNPEGCDFGLIVFNNNFGCFEVSYPGTFLLPDSIEFVDSEYSKFYKIGNIFDSPGFFVNVQEKRGDK